MPHLTHAVLFVPKVAKQKILPNNGNVVFSISLVSVLWSWLRVPNFQSKFGKSIFIWHCLIHIADFSVLNYIFFGSMYIIMLVIQYLGLKHCA